MGPESLAFKEWAKLEGLTFWTTLAEFKGATVAIHAEDYLQTLLTSSATREPLLPALGGLPFGLEKHVDNDLKNFEDAGIKPFFFFDGLDSAYRERHTISRESQKAVGILNEAWRLYDNGEGDEAVKNFGKAC